MTIAYASSILTLTGGASAAYLTPDNIILDAPAFSAASTYVVGSLIKQDAGQGLGLALYRCSSAVTVAGAFNSANWTVVAWKQGSRSMYMNSKFTVNGFFDETDWTMTYASGTYPVAGASARWRSGRVVTDATGRSVTTGGGKHIYLNTGLTWPFTQNPQMVSGCQLEWYGVYIKAYGDGFVKWFDASSTVHTLVNVTFDVLDTTYKWLMIGYGAQPSESSSFILIEALVGQLGSLPPISWTVPTAASIGWSQEDTASAKTMTINELAPIFKDASQKLSMNRHVANTNNEYITKNPKYDFVGRDSLPFGESGEKTVRTISHDLSISCINASTGVSVNPQVRIVSGSVEKANAMATGGKYSGNIQTYKKTLTAPSTTDVIDHTSLLVTLRDQAYTAGTVNVSYADLQAGSVSKSAGLFADANWTADGSSVTGVDFSLNNGAISAAIAASVPAQQIYNRWKWWSSQSAQMGINQSLITIADGVLVIVGSLTTSATISSGGNVTSGIKATGTITKTGSGSFNGLLTADSTGVQIAVTGLNPSGFTLDAAYPASVMTRKVGTTTWTRTSTTGTSLTISAEASADYEVRIRVPGYEWQTKTINTGSFGLSLDAALVAVTDLGGSAIFSKTTDSAQTGAIAYNATTQRIEITNAGSSELAIDFTNAYVKFQQILHSPTLVSVWENQIQTNTTKNGFVIPSGNQTHVYLSASSTAGAYLSFSIKYPDASDARDRFHGTTAGQIQFATSVTTLTVAVPTASENATAVRTNLATELGRLDAKVSDAVLSAVQKQVLTDLDSMTMGTGSAAKFTATALENAPASTGGGTGGTGGGLTATQSAQLATLHNTLVAHKFDLSAAVAEGATTLPIASAFEAGYFDGHYIVINDGSGSPIQRSISSHTAMGPMATLTLNAPLPAIASGQTVNILIRTTTQDGAQAGDAMALTSSERTAIADATQAAIIDETDGKKVVDAIVKAVSTGGLTESAIAQAVSDKVERSGGKLDKAMKAAQAADDQTA